MLFRSDMDKERMAELEKIEAHGAENGWVAPMTEEDRDFFAYFRSVFKRYNISPSKATRLEYDFVTRVADRETGVFPVINSTAYGRITLFRNRLIAGSIAASAGAALLAAGNHALSILISGRLPQPDGWNHAWFRSTAIVQIGRASCRERV